MHEVYLSLGSNQGDREQLLNRAVRLIDERVGEVTRQSSILETEPWGFQSDHKFLNAAVCCQTEKTPREVLLLTQQIERDLGRHKDVNCKSPNRQYVDRPIDIDILLYDDWKVNEPDLKIPHPLMRQRDFVMIPLKEIMTKDTNP
ncbi:MAG: 2-amino-4-hydroxy-6-hydroxymethyldihydropteridine diphosphokinase [Prevotella sp.]|nr:2-amino-4-hydroxy-6-hydroxymethyldihydropteridine diphosphokinase [Prevotella sp.]